MRELYRCPVRTIGGRNDQLCCLRFVRPHDPQVIGGAIAPRALVGDSFSASVPAKAAVTGLAVAQHRRLTRLRVELEDLRELASSDVPRKRQLLRPRAACDPRNRLPEKCLLFARRTRLVNLVQCFNATVPGRHVNAPVSCGPRTKPGRTNFLVRKEAVLSFERNYRNALEYQVAVVQLVALHAVGQRQWRCDHQHHDGAHHNGPLASMTVGHELRGSV